MKHKALTLLMIMTLAFGLVVTFSSLPPAIAAETVEHIDVGLSEAAQIKLLIGAVGILFFGYMWWIQRYIRLNDEKQASQDKRTDDVAADCQKTATSLVELMTEHRMTQELGKCAIGSNALRETLEELLAPIIKQNTRKPHDH